MVLRDIDRPLTFAHGDDLVGIPFLMPGERRRTRPCRGRGPHLVCLAAEGGNGSAPTGQRATVEAAIRRYIREHACDRDLDVGVARALGWSVFRVGAQSFRTGMTSGRVAEPDITSTGPRA